MSSFLSLPTGFRTNSDGKKNWSRAQNSFHICHSARARWNEMTTRERLREVYSTSWRVENVHVKVKDRTWIRREKSRASSLAFLPNHGISKERQTDTVDTYVVRSGLDLRVKSMLILVPEWRVADEEDVQDDTARPDVDRFPVRLFLQHFRAEVAGRSRKTFQQSLGFIPARRTRTRRIARRGIKGIRALRARNHVSCLTVRCRS